MYKRVLVPLDGSATGETILPVILQIAGPLDLEVVLLRVLEPYPKRIREDTSRTMLENFERTRQDDAAEYLAPLAVELRNRGVRVETTVRRGVPAEEIVEAARQVGADVIAMSTHGRTGLGRLLFGSVAAAVLRQAEIPVLLFRATETQVLSHSRKESKSKR